MSHSKLKQSPFSNIKIGGSSIFTYKPKKFLKSCPEIFSTDCNYKVYFSLCLLDLKGKVSEANAEALTKLIIALKPVPFTITNKFTHFNVSIIKNM